jgi:hypothetical protein
MFADPWQAQAFALAVTLPSKASSAGRNELRRSQPNLRRLRSAANPTLQGFRIDAKSRSIPPRLQTRAPAAPACSQAAPAEDGNSFIH